MKTNTVRSIVTTCLITVTSWLSMGHCDARPHCHSEPPSRIYISSYCYCGRPNYTERYFIGYSHCGRPMWAYRPVRQHRHPVNDEPRCHRESYSVPRRLQCTWESLFD